MSVESDPKASKRDSARPEDRSRQRSRPITSRELARILGVSQSTISRAFTDGASVSPRTREFIRESAERLGYQPNVIASILSKRSSDIVGVVVSDMQNPFYPALLERLSQRLEEGGRLPLLFSAPPGGDISDQLLLLRQYNVDAVIIVSATISSGPAVKWASDGRTVVLINRTIPDAPVASVCCDNAQGAIAVARHFHGLGHRKVAYVAGREDTSTNIEREHAFTRSAAELGLVLAAQVSTGEYSYDAGYRAAIEVSRSGADAIFFANDILAVGGLDALRDEVGLKVPEDISVVGFDDIGMARWPRYQLTTVRQPVERMLDTAIGLLPQSSREPAEAPALHRIPGELVVRRTTSPREARS